MGESSNFILMPMLKAALSQINSWTVAQIEEHSRSLADPLINYLRSNGIEFEPSEYFSSHLFSLKLPTGIDERILADRLAKNKVYISNRGGSLRVSVGVFNTPQDIEKLIDSIEQSFGKEFNAEFAKNAE